MSEVLYRDPSRIETTEQFAQALTALRDEAGLSIRETARLVSRHSPAPASASTIGGWFSGTHLPTPKLVSSGVFAALLRVCGETDDERTAQWLAALRRLRRATGPRPAAAQPPFRGLAPYEPEHAALFFGREDVVADLLRLVEAGGNGPVMVVGPSGCGKSSILRAGLVPARCGADRSACAIRTPGARPSAGLAGIEGVTLLVVDQFEELFTLCEEAEERRRYVDALCAAARSGTAVVLGLRADFYAHALREPALRAALQERQLVVGPMAEPQLRRAITGPARQAGLELEPGLVEVLLQDLRGSAGADAEAAHEAGALPLLSHALLTTWERAGGRKLTIEQYRGSGGIRGAVAKTAEDVYAGLASLKGGQDTARRLFLRLVWTNEGAVHTRRWLRREDWSGEGDGPRRAVLERFVAARLLTAGADRIGIAHEALLAAWPRLTGWLEADGAWRRFHRALRAAAQHWTEAARSPDGLFRGAVLETALQWCAVDEQRHSLGADELAFLAASAALRDRERHAGRRRARRRQQTIALVATLALLAVSVGVYARQANAAGRRERRIADRIAADALSRLVAGKADRLRSKDVSLAMQLALSAYRIAPTAEARSALLNSTAAPPAARLRGPAAPIVTAALSADGRRVAGLTDEPAVQLWSADPAGHFDRAATALADLAGAHTAVALDADGTTVAVGDEDGTVHLRGPSGAAHRLTAGGDRITALAISADGRLLSAGDGTGWLWLWDLMAPEGTGPLASARVATQTVSSVVFHPGGRLLAVGSYDATLRLVDLADPAHPALHPPLPGPASRIFGVAISPDGRRLAASTGAQHSAFLWDITRPANPVADTAPLTGPASWVNGVAFSPDGRTVALASSDGLLWLFDRATHEPIGKLPHPGPVEQVAFGADGDLITVGEDGTVRDWTFPGPVVTGARDSVFTAGFDRTGRLLAIGPGVADGTATLWDTTDPHRPRPAGPALVGPPGSGRVSGAVAVTPDGQTAAVGGVDGTVQLWDIATPGAPRLLGPAPAVAGDLIESLTPDPTGRTLAVSSDDGTVHLLDIRDPRHPQPRQALHPGPARPLYQAAFSPDGALLAAAGDDHRVYLWDLTDPQGVRLTATMEGFSSAVYTVAFRPTGRLLVAGSTDNTIRLWDVSAPDRPQPVGAALTGPVGNIYSLAFRPGSAVLAAGSSDNTVWLWDLARPAAPEYLATLTGPTAGVLGVAFSPDGHTVVAVSHDRTARLWDTDPRSAAVWVCHAAGAPLTRQEWQRYVPDAPFDPPC